MTGFAEVLEGSDTLELLRRHGAEIFRKEYPSGDPMTNNSESARETTRYVAPMYCGKDAPGKSVRVTLRHATIEGEAAPRQELSLNGT